MIRFFYVIAIFCLLYSLYTDKSKRWFLISSLSICIGSLLYFLLELSFVAIIFLSAMIASFLGDLCMAEKIRVTRNRIINGIIFFGIAHILYLIGFISLQIPVINIWNLFLGPILIIIIYLGVCYNPEQPPILKIFTFLYATLLGFLIIIISGMSTASELSLIFRITSLVGVILFVISDSVIAYTNFKAKIKNSEEIIAITYILAQILLQSSIHYL